MAKRKRQNKGYRIYRPTYGRSGESREAAKWAIEFRDHTDRVRPRRLAAYTDRQASDALGRIVAKLVAYRRGGKSIDRELVEWLEGAAHRVKVKLAEWGVIDADDVTSARSLTQHIEDFEKWHKTKRFKGRKPTPERTNLIVGRIKTIAEGCNFSAWSDVNDQDVHTYLSELSGKYAELTVRGYLQSMKQFCKWMVTAKRTVIDPLVSLEAKSYGSQIERHRRPMDAAEMRYLLAFTKSAPSRFGMTGEERRLVYLLASETGLRVKELRSLTKGSFKLLIDPPIVKVAAESTKNRKAAEIVLRTDTAAMMAEHLRRKTPDATAFNLPPSYDTADMIRADLADARAQWIDGAGTDKEQESRSESSFLAEVDHDGRILDFHCLRHTGSSLLAAAGVSPQVHQMRMRHGDMATTMSYYTHMYRQTEADAVAQLPDLTADDSSDEIKAG